MKKKSIISLFFFWHILIFGQGLTNTGTIIVVGENATVAISGKTGHYTNEEIGSTNGEIILDGSMSIYGGFFNNSTGPVFTGTDTIGRVNMVGDNLTLHEIGGTGITHFENLYCPASNTVKIPAGVEIHVKYNFILDGTLDIDGDLYIEDSFEYNGTITGTGTVHYESTTQQTVAPGSYPQLVLDNPGGLVLEDSVFVELELVLEVGGLILGENNLVLGPNATVVEIKAPATWVDASGTGMVIKMFNKTGIFEFPIGNFGDTPAYTPVIVDLKQATINNGQIGVRLKPEAHPGNNTGPGFPNYLNRYWVVESEGLSDVLYDIDFHYVVSDITGNEDSIDGAKYDTSKMTNWIHYSRVDTSGHHFEVNNLTEFSDFTGVQGFRAPTVAITNPIHESKVYEYELDISGTAADIDGDLTKVFVKLNDGTWQMAAGADPWSKTLTLIPGINTIYAKAKDNQDMESVEKQIEVILSVQEIAIPEGWSYISSYLEPLNMLVDSIMKSITDPYNLVIMSGKNGLYAPPPFNINTMVNWNCEMGYKVKLNEAAELVIRGDALIDNDPTYSAGVHIIPVLSDGLVEVSNLFTSPQSDIQYLWDMTTNNIYWPAGGIFTLSQLSAGVGYMACFNNEVTLDFPAYDGYFFDGVTVPQPYAKGPWPCQRTGNVHLISVNMEAANSLENADYIGAFDLLGNCLGYTPIDHRDQNYLITTYGDDKYTNQKDGGTEGELITFRVIYNENNDETELQPIYSNAFPNNNGLYADNGLSLITDFKESSNGMQAHGLGSRITLFPNPARDEVTLVCETDHYMSGYDIEFISTTGSIVKSISTEVAMTRINVTDLEPGVYVIKISSTEYTVYKKLVMQ